YSLYFSLVYSGAAIGQHLLILSVRAGDEATLQCNYVIHDQDECDGTSWFFSNSGSKVELVRRGQILDRLRVTENCSLVVKKVTEEDTGSYTCRQYNRSGAQQGPGSQVLLSVVTMTEHQNNDEVTLLCSVTTYWERRLTVKWLLQGQDVDEDNSDIKTSASYCSASVTFLTSHFSNTSRSDLFSCEVTADGNVQTFSLQSSGEDTAAAATTTATTESDSRSGFPTTASVITEDATGWWWWIIVVIVAVAALTIITVAVSRRKRTQGQKPQTDENIVRYGVDDGTVNYDNIRPPDGV
ncbi:uncharacterized protein LOC117541263, partial [Gymnodraco acuticeps]|uniref:Uncharacterized protein LOC117541263 n=1 Tax=Gymnodraco acuticeps TaxID=8218 RepID=A0A6P8UD86_GYMAC